MLGADGGLEWTRFRVQTPIVSRAVGVTLTSPKDTGRRGASFDMAIMPRAILARDPLPRQDHATVRAGEARAGVYG
jgi:hypothetical protein